MKAITALAILYLVGASSQAFSAPQIVTFTPTAGAPGDQVQLTGYGFLSKNVTVRFWNGANGVIAHIVFINSDTVMTVTVPKGITTGPISIQQGTALPTFSLDDFQAIGPGPFITGFLPDFGDVGTSVTVLGVHLGKTRDVLFNGTHTPFWPNAAGTAISTWVPTGASSGPITVVTDSGSSNSQASFTVVGPGPYVTDFAPQSGQAGTLVQIGGMHLAGTSKVTFNGVAGVHLAVIADTLIQVEAPAGVTTGPLRLTTALGSFVTSSDFYVTPVITRFSPTTGRADTNVVIRGTNLLGTTEVYFKTVPCTDFYVLNNSNLNAVVPVGAVTGPIRLVTPAGVAFSTSNFVVQPTIYGFSPSFGPAGTSVTITGANFNVGTPTVKFNGISAAAPTNIAFSHLTVRVPAGAATGPITLATADGSHTSGALFYLPPGIASFSPSNSAAGTVVKIIGQNFLGTTAVKFGATPAAGFTVTSNTVLSAMVPNGVVTGPISVTTPAGSAVSAAPFYGAPVISSFFPSHGVPGTSVKIDGMNFLAGTVQFNGLNARIASINNTQIVTTVPSGAKSGPITVRAPAGMAAGSEDFRLDYFSDVRVWLVHSSNPVTIGSNLLYTVTIVNAGPYAAQNPCFTNVLPGKVRLVSASIAPPWTLTTNGNMLIGSTPSSASGNSYVLKVQVAPLATGNITNWVYACSDNPDPASENNVASLITTVEPLPWLYVSLLANQVQVSWPVTLTNFALEYQDGFPSSPRWRMVTTPAVIIGEQKHVTESKTSPARLYRLHR